MSSLTYTKQTPDITRPDTCIRLNAGVSRCEAEYTHHDCTEQNLYIDIPRSARFSPSLAWSSSATVVPSDPAIIAEWRERRGSIIIAEGLLQVRGVIYPPLSIMRRLKDNLVDCCQRRNFVACVNNIQEPNPAEFNGMGGLRLSWHLRINLGGTNVCDLRIDLPGIFLWSWSSVGLIPPWVTISLIHFQGPGAQWWSAFIDQLGFNGPMQLNSSADRSHKFRCVIAVYGDYLPTLAFIEVQTPSYHRFYSRSVSSLLCP